MVSSVAFLSGLFAVDNGKDSLQGIDRESSTLAKLSILATSTEYLLILLSLLSDVDADVDIVNTLLVAARQVVCVVLLGNNDFPKHLALSLSCSSCNLILLQDDVAGGEVRDSVVVVVLGTSEGRLQLEVFGPLC